MFSIKKYYSLARFFDGSSVHWKDVKEWIVLLDRFGRLAPSTVYAFVASEYRKNGKYADASQLVSKGLEYWPQSRKLLKERANLAETVKNWAEARTSWNAVLTVSWKAKAPGIMGRIIEMHCRLGEYDAAQALLDDCQKRFPEKCFSKLKMLNSRELAFCAEFGIHPMAFWHYGYKLTCNTFHPDISDAGQSCPVDVLWVTAAPRFGNTVIQLSNVLNLASRMLAAEVWLPGFWFLEEEFVTRNGIRVRNKVVDEARSDSGKSILSGDFFQRSDFFDLLVSHRLPVSGMVNDVNIVFKRFEPLTDRDLVIHVRSGDVFEKGNIVHTEYGQPPLAFYKKVITSDKWDSIHIVYENENNPVVVPLVAFARKHASQVAVVSGDLKADIEFLLRAKVLVASRGSFIEAIAEFSKCLEKVYCFNETFRFPSGNGTVIEICDDRGEYADKILNNNWENTEWQRKLMLDYPEENLSVKLLQD